MLGDFSEPLWEAISSERLVFIPSSHMRPPMCSWAAKALYHFLTWTFSCSPKWDIFHSLSLFTWSANREPQKPMRLQDYQAEKKIRVPKPQDWFHISTKANNWGQMAAKQTDANLTAAFSWRRDQGRRDITKQEDGRNKDEREEKRGSSLPSVL